MRIGILGGGQLARMLALAGYPLGLEFIALDPVQDCCANRLMPTITAPYDDQSAIKKLLQVADVVTFENENIPLATAELIAANKPFYPGKNILASSQDRLTEKQLFQQLSIPTAEFQQIDTVVDVKMAAEKLGLPLIIKTRREGYDGKGQYRINNDSELKKFELPDNHHGFIAESVVAFEREVSIIAVRNVSGDVAFYDLCENVHQQGILMTTRNRRHDPLQEQAKMYADKLLQQFNYVGTLVIEFFVREGKLLANELAPRVHNSGHWTIEGAVTSQFENHLRAICDWPLGNTASVGYSLMQNMIGQHADKQQLLAIKNLHWHDYGKEPRQGRKLGHVTIVKEQPVVSADDELMHQLARWVVTV